MQYFLGYVSYEAEPVFSPTLFVEIRKRLGNDKFNEMSTAIINTAFGGKKKVAKKSDTIAEENKEEIRKEKLRRKKQYRERIPIEGKFGQGKNGYRLNYIRAKLPETSESWIGCIFFVMNQINLSAKKINSTVNWLKKALYFLLTGLIVRKRYNLSFANI